MPWYTNHFINRTVGGFIRFFSVKFPRAMHDKFQQRWRVAGTRMIKASDNIRFRFSAQWDDHIADQLYYNPKKYSEIHELELFAQLAKKAKTILDIGANTGLYSIYCSLVNKDSLIYAFEPYPVNLRRLKKNISINGLTNIRVVEKALGNENNKVSFTVPLKDQVCDALSVDQEFTNRFYKGQVEFTQMEVEQITLDQFISEEKLEKVELVKIDVENYELQVFYGAEKFLREQSPAIMVEIFVSPEKIRFFEEFLKPKGYNCYIILSDGLVKTETLIDNPDCRNYFFSKKKSDHVYLSFKDMSLIASELL